MKKIWLDSYPDHVKSELSNSEFNSISEIFKHASEKFSDLVAFNNLGYTEDAGLNDEKSYKIVYSRGVEKQISNELIQGSFLAVLFSLFVIFIYIAFRFRKWQYGLGALVAMFHDVLVVLGLFSIFYNTLPFSMEIDQT